MNKKIIAAACGLLVSGVVCADDFRYYVGAEAGYNKYSHGSSKSILKNAAQSMLGGNFHMKSKLPSIGVLAGLRYCDYVGAEIGYTFYKKAKGNLSATGYSADSALKVGNVSADVLGYMPVCKDFEIIGALGVGQMRIKPSLNTALPAGTVLPADINKVLNTNTNKIGVRAGIGAQYNFGNSLAARAMVRYQKVGKKNGVEWIKGVTSINAALTYTF